MVLINEFQPNPDGADPSSQSFELLGTPGETFSGFIVSIESDPGTSAGTIDRISAISGTFDANGLLELAIPDLENPSFTVVLTGDDMTAVLNDRIDTTGDGNIDNISILGTIHDAIGIPDTDGETLYGAALGGTDFAYTGAGPELIFRDSVSQELFAVNAAAPSTTPSTVAYRTDGTTVDVSAFDQDPAQGTSFGQVNPTLSTTPPPVTARINEFQSNPEGTDPANTTVELIGTAGATFSGYILSIESDGASGTVDRATAVSGTFDSNGLLVVDIPDLENPSFTIVLTGDDFTGAIGTDIDTNDDGTADDLSQLGTVLDAIGVPDSTADVASLYGVDLGGVDFAFTGAEPELIFRDGATGELFAVNQIDPSSPVSTEAYRVDGSTVPIGDFDVDPTDGTSFGEVNPILDGIAPPDVTTFALINEFEPNPAGADPSTQRVELKGDPNTTFEGWLVSVENDGADGVVDSAAQVSGTFDANGLLVVEIPDLENPSNALILTDSFTGTVASTDIDGDDDGTVDDTSAFGTILDAIGVSDNAADDATLYGAQLGGADVLFNGEFEPLNIFRDSVSGALYNSVTVDFGEPSERIGVFDAAGVEQDASEFDGDPLSTTFNATNPAQTDLPNIKINEVDADQADTDDAEFIELFGAAGASLDGLSLVLYNGSDDASYDAIDLDSFSLDENGFFVVGSANVANVDLVAFTTNGIQNGADAVALVVGDASDFPNDTPIASLDTATLVDAIVYGTSDANDTALLTALGETTQFNDTTTVSMSRVPDGTGAFVEQAATPGATNASTPVDPVFADAFIHDIQGVTNLASGTLVGTVGAADVSPMLGQAVRVEGIITKYLPELGGFYVQEEDADADADLFSSEGIFVQSSYVPGNADGIERVVVEGVVMEIEGETTLDASAVTLSGTTAAFSEVSATTVTFPTATVLMDADGDYVANLEAYEGMYVTVNTEMFVTELFNLDRFGTIRLSAEDRLEQFTQSNLPDAAGFDQHLQDNAARSLLIDDGTDVQNPNPILVPGLGSDGTLDNGDVFRMGDSYSGLTGVLSFAEDDQSSSEEPEYRLHTPDGTLTQNNPQPKLGEDLGSDYRVASLNVLNFFTTLDEFPSVGEGSGPNGLDPRGADANPQNASPTPGTLDEYNRQRDKLVQQIIALDADVLGLVELENDFLTGGAAPTGTGTVVGSGVAIEELVNAVNAELGANIYNYVRPSSGEFVGTDAIAVGFIYDTTTTDLNGASAVLDSSDFTDPNGTGIGRNRAALAQTFEEIASGESFTAAVNHFKSKGASGLTAGVGSNPDSDQGDGQGFWNDTRTKAAQELANWLATDPTGSGDADVLILGDLNAYQEEDPIRALETLGYTDLAEEFIADPYSFVFDGQKGTLDYALANTDLLAQVTGVTEVHLNADEADAFDYNLEFGRDPSLYSADLFRASDHDPVVIGLDLSGDDPVNVIVGEVGEDNTLSGTDGRDSMTGGLGRDVLRGGLDDDTIEGGDGRNFLRGNEGDDLLNGGADADNLYGGANDDELNGFGGNDRLDGGAGDDSLSGGADDDRLYGGIGADTLYGGSGDDVMGASNLLSRIGDGFADVFQFGDADGIDRVFGFETGLDQAHLLDGGSYTLTVMNGNSLLEYGTTEVVFLDAILDASDFVL